MENNYFRITGYYPQEDFSFIVDSYGRFEKLWQFSVYLRDKGITVLEVSKDGNFADGNIDRAEYDKENIILRADGSIDLKLESGEIISADRRDAHIKALVRNNADDDYKSVKIA